MASLITNVLYLSPSAGLSLAGLGCLWLIPLSTSIYLSAVYLGLAVCLFYAAYRLGRYGFNSLEKIDDLLPRLKSGVSYAASVC